MLSEIGRQTFGREKAIDKTHLRLRLANYIAKNGQAEGVELCRVLGSSAATLLRVCKESPEVVLSGGPRNRRYYRARAIPIVASPVSIFEISEQGSLHILGEMFPVHGKRETGDFLFRASRNETRSSRKEIHFDGIPHFLLIHAPGYLGRGLAEGRPEPKLPSVLRYWSADIALRYLTANGHDNVGSLIIGEPAANIWLQCARKATRIKSSERESEYAKLSRNALLASPGSSAGGDQPKFLVEVILERNSESKEASEEYISALVKFSPPNFMLG